MQEAEIVTMVTQAQPPSCEALMVFLRLQRLKSKSRPNFQRLSVGCTFSEPVRREERPVLETK